MEIIKTKNGILLIIRNDQGKISKVYAGPIVLCKIKELFNPLNLN